MGGFTINLWQTEFWNNFCSPRYWGVFIILPLVLMNAIYTCAMVLVSTYYDNFSDLQHAGHFTLLLANVLVVVSGFLSIHFLTLNPKLMRISYCLLLQAALIIAFILGIVTLVLMLTTPNVGDIRDHSRRYVHTYHKVPYMMRSVFKEKQCCGITRFGDVFKKVIQRETITNMTLAKQNMTSTYEIDVIYFRIPPACCKKKHLKKCQKWTADVVIKEDFRMQKKKMLNTRPCLNMTKGDVYSKIRKTETYQIYLRTVAAAGAIFIFIFGILSVLNYYIWYKFPRMPPGSRPDQFIEDMRFFMTCQYRMLKRSMEETKRRRSEEQEAMMEAKKVHPSQIAIRHQKIMVSMQNMRTLEREMRKQDRTEKVLLGVQKSKSNLTSKSGLNITTSSMGSFRRDLLRPPSRMDI